MAADGREPPEVDGPGLVGVRLHSRAPLSPEWLVRAVLPAWRRLRYDEGAGVVHLRPGWLHGPHVDLVARPADGRALPWEEVAERLDPGEPPADAVLDEGTYLDQARETGRLEGVAPPYLPVHAHGTRVWLHDDEPDPWGETLGTVRDLALTRLTDAVVETARLLTEEPGAATRHVGEVFAALAGAHPRGHGFGVFSLRSHAEAFLAWAAASTDPRPAFDRRLQRDAPVFRALVEQALSGTSDAHASRWRAACDYAGGALDAAVATGVLGAEALDGVAGSFDEAAMRPPGASPDAPTTASEFHRTVEESGVTRGAGQWFTSYRVLLNLAYQRLPLLAVPPMHRYYFCYAVAETVDQVLGESWRERLARVGTREAVAAGAPA